MGVSGAATATALAWSVNFFGSLWVLRVREKLLSFSIPDFGKTMKYWVVILKMGLPISVANMLTPISAAIMTALIAPYGEAAVAGFGAGSRIESLFLAVCFALTASLSPYMAQNLGAGKFDRARSALIQAVRFAVLIQMAFYPLIFILAPQLARIFSEDRTVIDMSVLFLRIMPIGTCFYGAMIVFNTAFNAAHQTHKTMVVSIIRVFLCYTPLAWIGGLAYDVPGLFTGAVIGNGIASLIGWVIVKRTYSTIEDQEIFKPQKQQEFTVPELESEAVARGQFDTG